MSASGLEPHSLELLARALEDAAVVLVDAGGTVRLLSEGAARLLGINRQQGEQRSAVDVLGPAAWSDEELVELPTGGQTTLRVRRNVFVHEEGAAVHVFAPLESDEAHQQQQMLRYAKDLSSAWSSERDKTQQLADARDRLEETVEELRAANEALARQRDALSHEVQEKGQELLLVRAELHGGAAKDGTVVFHGMASGDEKMLRLFHTLRLVGGADATVLLQGESGTGKELAARALHAESRRSTGPFVAINCAAISPTLAESQLFGHVKGSFTGAIANHPGVFRHAHGGTLFLDEVAELPLELQSKLLRAIQDREVTPVGATAAVPIDVRIVAASHRSLPDEVRAGRFREDLMYRLRVVPMEIPPIREREGDLPRLVRHLMERFNASRGAKVKRIAPAAARRLLEHPWPGNVRELENAFEHAFAVAEGEEIGLAHLPPDLQRPSTGPREPRAPTESTEPTSPAAPSGTFASDDEEREAIRAAIEAAGGRIAEAARNLGMSRTTFHRRRKKHRLS